MSKKILFALLILSAYSCLKDPLPDIYVGTVTNTYTSNLNPDQEETVTIKTFSDTIIVSENSERVKFIYNLRDYSRSNSYTLYINKDDIDDLYVHDDGNNERITFFFSDKKTLKMNYTFNNGIGDGFYSDKREFIGTKD